jgi:predicted DsbA family dithiol-disulfide isomerase
MANTFYFDFVDPLSYLQELELKELELADIGGSVERVGFELVPPPEPVTALSDPRWNARWDEARRLAASAGVRLAPPPLVPWSRKAHELNAHAVEIGRGDEMRGAIFDAYFAKGDDIGRVDRLVALAVSLGMDRTEVKAVLDVDRHQEDVTEARRAALEAGVADTPTIVISGKAMRGFHNRADLGSLLR